MIRAINDIKECIEILSFCLEKIKVNKRIMDNKKYDNIYSVELISKWVEEGLPFRDAYLKLKKEMKFGPKNLPKDINHIHLGSIGNLALDKIKLKMKKYF